MMKVMSECKAASEPVMVEPTDSTSHVHEQKHSFAASELQPQFWFGARFLFWSLSMFSKAKTRVYARIFPISPFYVE